MMEMNDNLTGKQQRNGTFQYILIQKFNKVDM